MNIAKDMTVGTKQPETSIRRNIAAATIGSALEWYDVLVYAYVAPEIGRAFFPSEDPMVSTAIALGGFGVSYLARPLGGIILGRYADRAGRKAALVLVSMLMFAATAVITVLPGYAAIGILAPILLFAAKLAQGFSAGGEFGSAVAYLAEQHPERRGFYTSWQFASQGVAIILAAGVTALVSFFLTVAQMDAWGWRIPFALGLVIGPVAFYLRSHATETPEFVQARQESVPTGILWGRIVIGAGMVALATAALYTLIYLPTLGTSALGLSKTAAQTCSVLSGAILLVATPAFGWMSDRVGHFRLAMIAAAIAAVLSIPLFRLLDLSLGLPGLAMTQAGLALVAAAYLASLSPCLAEIFPVSSRTFSISLSYNIAVLTIGGFAPLGLAMLTSVSSEHYILGAYPALAALVAYISLRAQTCTSRSAPAYQF